MPPGPSEHPERHDDLSCKRQSCGLAVAILDPSPLWWNTSMLTSATDQELLARQAALQTEAADVLAGLDLDSLFRDVGPVLVMGSYVSGLMCWRDLDVGLLAG